MNGAGAKNTRCGSLWRGFVANQTSPLNAEELAAFAGKRILITGAGGFLGSALARRLAQTAAAHLTLLDTSEYGLYRLQQQLHALRRDSDSALMVGSVNDGPLLEEVFAQEPDIVFHAAALKHVPLMEANALAAAETNILGTLALTEAALRARTPIFVHLSTDKAVAPISIMGATKNIAEKIVLAARKRHSNATEVTAVRLCNVLGSTGSVAPLFARQIAAGGPLTLTDPEATRYFLSPTDAVRHLLRGAIYPVRSGLLVPEVNEAHRVQDLAEYMLARAGQASSTVAMTHTGLRPADKLHEQLLASEESVVAHSATQMLEVHSPLGLSALAATLPEIAAAVASRDRERLHLALERMVPGFRDTNTQASPAEALV